MATVDFAMFQFTPVLRRATCASTSCSSAISFNSRPSCDGRHLRPFCEAFIASFNSRPSCDGRLDVLDVAGAAECFNSRPACDGRLEQCRTAGVPVFVFQFTPVLRRATARRGSRVNLRLSFNSRPSCDGRPSPASRKHVKRKFQFTPVLRRATVSLLICASTGCFNSRPSCDGRRGIESRSSGDAVFQFTPVLRRATGRLPRRVRVCGFQFTPVLRRATLTIGPMRRI